MVEKSNKNGLQRCFFKKVLKNLIKLMHYQWKRMKSGYMFVNSHYRTYEFIVDNFSLEKMENHLSKLKNPVRTA